MARSSVATDNFNRADGAIGSDWSYIRLSSWQGNPPHIVSNALAGRALGTNHQVVRWNGAGSFSDDQYAKIALGGMGWFGTDYMIGAVVRCSADTDANADYYAFLVVDDQSNGGNKTCKLVKRINGTETVIATITTTSWTNGDTVELEAEGTTLRIFKNGTQIGSDYTSQTDLSTGKPGILIAGDLAGLPAAQDWEGGDITAPAPTAPTSPTTSNASSRSFTASWTDASADETGFKVEYAPSPYSSWTAATGSPTAANATSLSITGLPPGTSYKFRVASSGAGGDSAWVESSVVATLPALVLYPTSDTAAGDWTPSTGSDLFAVVDDTSDADYITTTVAGRVKLRLPATTTPSVRTDHRVLYRIKGDGSTQCKVSLVQGDPSETEIATETITPTASYVAHVLSITSVEAADITGYGGDLYLVFEAL